jgi:hypothetical protein
MRTFIKLTLLLAASAAMGTMAATSVTCGVGLINGTDTWCGVGYFWILAVPISIVVAWITGALLLLPFNKLKLKAWWHYAVAGLIAAVPVWMSFAQPFSSLRWQQSGPYDSLNYLGTGLISSVLFWLLSIRSNRS